MGQDNLSVRGRMYQPIHDPLLGNVLVTKERTPGVRGAPARVDDYISVMIEEQTGTRDGGLKAQSVGGKIVGHADFPASPGFPNGRTVLFVHVPTNMLGTKARGLIAGRDLSAEEALRRDGIFLDQPVKLPTPVGRTDLGRLPVGRTRNLAAAAPLTEALRAIEMDQANIFQGGVSGVVVGVIDTGLDAGHPSVFPTAAILSRDSVTGEGGFDQNGHGTWCAGAVAGREVVINGELYRGVNPLAQLRIFQGLDGSGSGTTSGIVELVAKAIAYHDISVLSLSLGSDATQNDPLGKALNDASEQGITVCAAAGNEGSAFIGSPAHDDFIFSVAAIDSRSRRPASFTNNRGDQFFSSSYKLPFDSYPWVNHTGDTEPNLGAPGVNLLGPFKGGQWVKISGTSMATPLTAGAASLSAGWKMQKRPTDDPRETYEVTGLALMDGNPLGDFPTTSAGAVYLNIPTLEIGTEKYVMLPYVEIGSKRAGKKGTTIKIKPVLGNLSGDELKNATYDWTVTRANGQSVHHATTPELSWNTNDIRSSTKRPARGFLFSIDDTSKKSPAEANPAAETTETFKVRLTVQVGGTTPLTDTIDVDLTLPIENGGGGCFGGN